MNNGVRSYSSGDTVYFDLASQLRQSNNTPNPPATESENPPATELEKPPVLFLFADCLRFIQDNQDAEPNSKIIEQLDQLMDTDPKFIWSHIPRLFIQKNNPRNFKDTLDLTIRVCDYFLKTKKNFLIADKIFDYFLTEIVKGQFDRYIALIECLFDNEGPLLDRIPEILERAEQSRLEELDEDTLSVDIAKIRALTVRFFIRTINEALVHESYFHSLIHQDIKDTFVMFLSRDNVEPEVVTYLVNNPQFLLWLKAQDNELKVSDTFVAQFVDHVDGMGESRKFQHFANCKDLFEGRLPARFYQLKFEVMSNQLLQNEMVDDVEKGLTQLIYGLCSEGVLALTVVQGDEICNRVSEIAIARNIKTVSFQKAWMRLTDSVGQGKLYPLDNVVAESMLSELPKDITTDRGLKLSERLLSDETTIDKGIKLLAKVVTREKKFTVTISVDILKKIHYIKPERDYEAVSQLFRDLFKLCSHVHAILKKSNQKNSPELKAIFADLLKLLERHPEESMNAQFWDGVVTLGKEIGGLQDGNPTGTLPKVDQRLLLSSITRNLNKLNDKNITAEQIYETFHVILTIFDRLPKELKKSVVDALVFQINKYVTARQTGMLLELSLLFTDPKVVAALNDPQHSLSVKKALFQLLKAVSELVSEDQLVTAVKAAEASTSLAPEALDTVVQALLARFSAAGSLTKAASTLLCSIIDDRFLLLKSGDRIHSNHHNLFKLAIIAYSNPEFTPIEGVVKLQRFLELLLVVNDAERALVCLNQYVEIALKYKEKFSEIDTMILFSYYVKATTGNKFLKQFTDSFSFADLQMNLLWLFHQKQICGFEMTTLLAHLITEPKSSKYDHEFEGILKAYLENATVLLGRFSYELLDAVDNTVVVNRFNTERLLRFFITWCISGPGDQIGTVESIVTSVVHFISKGRQIQSGELLIKFVEAFVNFIQRPLLAHENNFAISCLIMLANCDRLYKALDNATADLLLDQIAFHIVYIFNCEYFAYDADNCAREDYIEEILNTTDLLSAPDYVALSKRPIWRTLLLKADAESTHISIDDVFTYGFLGVGKMLDYLNPATAIMNNISGRMDKALQNELTTELSSMATVKIPFKGKLKCDFLFKFIHELMGYHWDANGGIKILTVFYIWELIKHFKKSFPEEKAKFSELALNFVFLPQKMSLHIARLHHILCSTWVLGHPLVHFPTNRVFMVKALLEYDTYVPTIVDKDKAKEVFEFFLDQLLHHSSIYSLLCIRLLPQLVHIKGDEFVLKTYPNIIVNFFKGIVHDCREVKILYSLYPEFLLTVPHLLHLESVEPADKAHIVGLLVLFYHLCVKGEILSNCPNPLELRDRCLSTMLKEGWLDEDDEQYINLKEIIED